MARLRLIIKKPKGFGLIEILIALLIISILSVALLPAFQLYINKTKFQDVVHASAALKAAVEICILKNNAITNCDADSNGIPPTQTNFPAGTYVSQVTIAGGVITGTSTADLGSTTYILTPTYTSNAILWNSSGTCVANGYCVQNSTTGSTNSGSTNSGSTNSGSSYTSVQQTTLSQCSANPGTCTSGEYYFTLDFFGSNELAGGGATLGACTTKATNWSPSNSGGRVAVSGSCVQAP